MISSSFVPPEPIRRLRTHTRYRRHLTQARTAEKQRVSLTPDSLFVCPRCGAQPPSGGGVALNAAALVGGALTGICRRCEHTWAFTAGAPSTTTSGAANTAGATVLTVVAGAAFVTVGAWVVIDSASLDGGAELVQVSAAGGATTIPSRTRRCASPTPPGPP